MNEKIKASHKVLGIMSMLLCLFIFMSYGWDTFSTITERSGLSGEMYLYYNLTQLQYSSYTGLVSAGGLVFIVLFSISFFRKDSKMIKKLSLCFSIFFALIVLAEILLQLKFVGKG